MELEEMKTVWQDLTKELNQQKKLTNKIILKMTQQEYKSKINKIAIPEVIGSVFCFGMAITLLVNLPLYHNPLTMACGIVSIVILLALPVASLRSIRRLNSINLTQNSYKETLMEYRLGRRQLKVVQQVGFVLSFFLLFTSLPPLSMIMKGKDLFAESSTWLWYVPFGVLFFALFTFYVYRCYKSIIHSTDQLIEDLE